MSKLDKKTKETLENTQPDEELKYHTKLKEYYKTQYEYHSKKVEELKNGINK